MNITIMYPKNEDIVLGDPTTKAALKARFKKNVVENVDVSFLNTKKSMQSRIIVTVCDCTGNKNEIKKEIEEAFSRVAHYPKEKIKINVE